MAEPSSSSPEPSPTIPYRTYAFDLSIIECAQVASTAERFAPAGPGPFFIVVEFSPQGRRWFFQEQNIIGWVDRQGVAGPDAGLLTIPVFLLDTIVNMFDGHASVGVRIDHDLRTITVGDDDAEYQMTLPIQRATPVHVEHDVASRIVIEPSQLSKLGFALMTVPVAVPDPDEVNIPLPFMKFSFDGAVLSAQLDWSNFDGPRMSVSVPAVGDHRGEFSAFAQVLVRELCVLRTDVDEPVVIEFSAGSPNLMFVTTPELSMKVDLGFEHVFWHRRALVSALEDDDLEVVNDDRIAWDPTVRSVLDDAVVDATITLGGDGPATHVRLSCLVVKDTPWTLEIAAEINAWNDQWGNIKLVRHDDDLFAMCDIPVEMIPTVPAAVREVAEKSRKVREVIGVFI